MSSILTNGSAMGALQTLRSISQSLNKTQDQASTGLRIAKASDNAAYWSIATTMRSDKSAISAVADTLGLGSSVVETAYSGMDSIASTLSQFSAKLVTAKEDSVDKTKVQAELDQLKQQILSVAQSASFNGVNWLQTSITDMSDPSQAQTSLASSFTRDSNGSTSVNSTAVDLSSISLFNSTGGGILQGDPVTMSMGDLGGLLGTNDTTHGGITGETQYHGVTSPATFSSTDSLNFDLTVDASTVSPGITYNITIDKNTIDAALGTTNGLISNSNDMTSVLTKAFANAGVSTAWVGPNNSSDYIIFTNETSGQAGSGVSVSNVSSTLSSGYTFGLNQPLIVDFNNWPTGTSSFDFSEPFQINGTSTFSFDYTPKNGATTKITVNADLINQTLGETDGTISSATDMAAVLAAAASGTDLSVASSGTNVVFSRNDIWGSKAGFTVGNVTKNDGLYADFNLLDVDVTKPNADIDDYIDGLNYMLSETTAAAAKLGSLSSRIDMQTTFTHSLMDSIESGIGKLVDADMEQVSSRLAALQTQQQLSVQSLSIANSSAQSLLSLFRG